MLLSEKQAFDQTEKPDKWRCQKAWNNAHHDERRAHDLVARAIRAGTLKKGRCTVCGSLRSEAHHPRYDQPLLVEWMCRKHHRELHAALRRASK
jgi:hypothetical protein